MSSFSIGLTALSTSQRALDVIGQNIANASTPGYHRQVARLSTRYPTEIAGLSIGTGVQITDVTRMRDGMLEAAITQQSSELSDTTAQLTAMRNIESFLSGGSGSISDRLDAFFNQLEQLSAKPDDSTLRQGVLGSASALTDAINATANSLSQIRSNLDSQVQGTLDEIGPLTERIADLNDSIQRSEIRGVAANDLRDQRDQLVNDLADRVGVRVIEQDRGQVAVLLGGVALVVGDRVTKLSSGTDDQGNLIVKVAGSDSAIPISGGTVGGLLQVRNKILPDYEQRLQEFSDELTRRVDAIHATGLGLDGPMKSLSGQRAATSVSIPLAGAGLALAPQAGSLFITVTDLATGNRTTSEVAIDPATQSLTDIATAISGLAHIQASTDPQTKTLRIFASSGYAFDFAGRLDPSPATAGITGSTVPSIGGAYTGTKNDTFNFRIVGSGTIGVTPNLSLEVKNSAGSVIASLNVGQGYEPGSALRIADGVTVQLAAGTANNGDTFSEQVVANADTAGILPALGLNSFFVGQYASDIRVRDDLIANPNLLAASLTGQPADGTNLRRLAAVRDLPVLGNGTQTLHQAYAAMVGDVGQQVQALDQSQTNQTTLRQSLSAQQQSISGVDSNEELVKLVEFQRAFQLASRYISAVNEALTDLYHMA